MLLLPVMMIEFRLTKISFPFLLNMEFDVNDLGIILEDLASSICSDDAQKNRQMTTEIIPFKPSRDYRLGNVISFRLLTVLIWLHHIVYFSCVVCRIRCPSNDS